MKKTIAVLMLAAGMAVSARAQVIYSADFGTAGIGWEHTTSSPVPTAPNSTDGSNWTIGYTANPATDTSTNSFITSINPITSGGELISSDWGGSGYFDTFTIDVSTLSLININISAATAFGTDVFNAGGEHFTWSYTLDGGIPVTSAFTADGSLSPSWNNIDVSSASSLIVGFTFNINGDSDGFIVSSLTVNAVPEPGTYLLLGLGIAVVYMVRRRTQKA